mmetsp:Transcript_20244/g.33880  ORF Transcript_20244/g.33880 Transcript_20244/m.33880 type:complete len:700 (-) Transcript_20244:131-2230(-)
MKGTSNIIIAVISIFLYGLLSVTCFYYASTFWNFRTGEFCGGRYGIPKFCFFVVLSISALLDIPLFLSCAALGGPASCEWNSPLYIFCWILHLIANCGYVYAIITPPVLWWDIVQYKDGMLWNSAYPCDRTKLFFRISHGIYCMNEFLTIFGAIIFMKAHDQASYTQSNTIGAMSNCFSPVCLIVITSACVWAGIHLQRHVMSVQLSGSTQTKILMHLNFTMFFIAATYLARALLVFSLWGATPHYYRAFMAPLRDNYLIWVIGTRWLPMVCCSFCLVNEMRLKGVDARSKSKDYPDRGGCSGGDGGGGNSRNNSSSSAGGLGITRGLFNLLQDKSTHTVSLDSDSSANMNKNKHKDQNTYNGSRSSGDRSNTQSTTSQQNTPLLSEFEEDGHFSNVNVDGDIGSSSRGSSAFPLLMESTGSGSGDHRLPVGVGSGTSVLLRRGYSSSSEVTSESPSNNGSQSGGYLSHLVNPFLRTFTMNSSTGSRTPGRRSSLGEPPTPVAGINTTPDNLTGNVSCAGVGFDEEGTNSSRIPPIQSTLLLAADDDDDELAFSGAIIRDNISISTSSVPYLGQPQQHIGESNANSQQLGLQPPHYQNQLQDYHHHHSSIGGYSPPDASAKIDHFFTTSALHARSSLSSGVLMSEGLVEGDTHDAQQQQQQQWVEDSSISSRDAAVATASAGSSYTNVDGDNTGHTCIS